jgi:hypothetical protein
MLDDDERSGVLELDRRDRLEALARAASQPAMRH